MSVELFFPREMDTSNVSVEMHYSPNVIIVTDAVPNTNPLTSRNTGDVLVVKEKKGRRRYIAFNLNADLNREDLIKKLNSISDDAPYVVQCSEGWAIVRTSPEGRDETIRMISEIDPSSKSLLTSGTLITLRKRFPKLEELRAPARR